MGQNVNYLLGGSSQLLGADPEVYRQQLVQQEQARIAAMPQQNQLGATIGSMLGRGIANVAQDRNFFEVTNPVLQKLTKIQDVYDTSMKEADPNDPLSFYTSLQKNFAAAGLGQQALMAQVEGKKYEDLNLKTEATRTEVYKNNLPLLNADIAKFRAAGNDEKANQLADMLGRFQVKEDRAAALQNVEILYKSAATDAQRAQAEKLRTDAKEGKVQIVQTPASMGNPATISVYRDGKLESQTAVNPTAVPGAATPTEAPKKGDKKDGSAYFINPAPAASGNVAAAQSVIAAPNLGNVSIPAAYQSPARQAIPSANLAQQLGFGSAPAVAPTQMQYTPEQYRDAAILRLNPNINLNALSESDKQIIAQQLGL